MLRLFSLFLLVSFPCLLFGQGGDDSDSLLIKAKHSLRQGNDLDAQALAEQILKLPQSLDNTIQKAFAHRLIAKISASHSQKAEQIDHLYRSYSYFKEVNNQPQVQESLRLIGCYYLSMNLPQRANEFLNQAYNETYPGSDTIFIIHVLNNKAWLFSLQNKNNDARSLLEQAILLSQKKAYQQGLVENWNDLAYTYKKEHDLLKMKACLKEALLHASENSDTLVILFKGLGLAYRAEKNTDSALYYFEKGISLAGKNKESEMTLSQLLSELYKSKGDTEKAFALLSRSYQLQRTIFDEGLREKILYLDTSYKIHEHDVQQDRDQRKSKMIFIGFVASIILLIAAGITILWLRKNNHFIATQKAKLRSTHTKLVQSEFLYRQFFDNSPGLIIIHQLDGTIRSANRTAETLLKVEKNRLNGHSIREYLHPNYRERFEDFIKVTHQQNSNVGWMRVIDSEGTEKILRFHNTVVSPEQGDSYVIGFALDQTEVFKVRMDAEHERKKLQSVMENSPDIFSILDPEGSIRYMNRSNFFDVKAIIGKNILQFLPQDQAIRFYKKLQTVFLSRQPDQIEESFRGKHYLTKLVPIVQGDQIIEVLTINTDVTENKHRQEKEKELNQRIELSEKRYRQLVEESKVLICTHDSQGVILNINRPGAAMVGFSVEELEGINLSTILPHEFRSQYTHYLSEILEKGIFEGFLTIFTKKKNRVVLLYRNVLISDEGHDPYILATAQDVTEWKKAEHRERKTRKDLELVVASTDDFIAEFDEHAHFKNIWCRDESKLFMPVSSFVGKTIIESFTHAPEFATEATRLYQEVLATKETRTIEIDDVFSPVPLFYLARLSPIIEEDERCVRCTVLVTNITKRKLAEERLSEERLLLRTIIDNLPLSIYVKNTEHKKILANRIEYEQVGVTDENMILGTTDTDGLALHSVEESFKEDVQVLAGDQILGKEVMSTKKDGSNSWFLVSKVPLHNNADQITGLVGISLDISKRKLIEMELLKAKEMAEESNRLKTIFLGSLSHEVRTPLQGILGFAEILESPGIPDNKRSQYLEFIKKRAIDMQDIIDSLLDMASIETGEIRSFPVETNLYELIQESVFNSLQADYKGMHVQLLLENNIAHKRIIQIDPVHLRQVLTNLVKNGMKFTNQGSVSIICDEYADHFLFRIVDTGIGIEPDKLEHVFEPFRQAHEGLSRSKGGIGLGLSICKKMVEMWGGSLSVKSKVDQGSTFSFTVPII